jgi:spore coat polysaccharide biosynthesis protein SpsF (cytidylyltransferase family)
MLVNVIIQSRMSSRRFPGKVLSPFLGKPLFYHVVKQMKKIGIYNSIILATSTDKTDDTLAAYAKDLGLNVFRGSLNNVVERFSMALDIYKCDAFFRVCGDSPLLPPYLLNHAIKIYKKKKYDLITNIFPRTFPAGMSIELFNTQTFLRSVGKINDKAEKEHISRYFYNNYKKFKLYNFECNLPTDPDLKLAVDNISDIKKIEQWFLQNKNELQKLFVIKKVKN